MALLASLRETGRDMVGIGGVLEIREVARHAGVGCQRVVVVDVTIGALPGRHGVHSREREVGEVVVERRIRPVAGVVALVASLREIRSDVVRIRRALEIFQVATHAARAVQRVVVVDMAIGALARRNRVHAGQSESSRGVVELSIGPLHYVMTLFACRGETSMRHRARRAGEILLVTREARHTRQVVVVVDVAISALAGRIRMSASQDEPGGAMVEARKIDVQPVVGRMTALASSRELSRNVAWIVGTGKVRLVARIARGRHRLEFAVRASFVAGVAVDRGVGTRQREPVVVLLNIFNRDLPSPHRVALFAARAQLAPVNIGMAVLAALTNIRENHLHVTRGTGDGSVHATQRIAGLAMVELGNGADRPPAIRRVAVLAGNSQVSVRTVADFSDLRTHRSHESGKRKYQTESYFQVGCDPSAHNLPPACVL